ncbi:hypothetical protein ACE1SV_01680 [Streptomyces sennicomposti]
MPLLPVVGAPVALVQSGDVPGGVGLHVGAADSDAAHDPLLALGGWGKVLSSPEGPAIRSGGPGAGHRGQRTPLSLPARQCGS